MTESVCVREMERKKNPFLLRDVLGLEILSHFLQILNQLKKTLFFKSLTKKDFNLKIRFFL